MPRILASVALSLLLLGMQHRLVVHELSHLGARLDRGAGTVLLVADDGACLECALLAGGSHAVPADGTHAAPAPERPSPPVALAYESPNRAFAASYLSRAPPRV